MRSGRPVAGLLAMVALLAGSLSGRIEAHSGLRFSSPIEGATLGASPDYVQLTLLERPEVSLSTIRVVDTQGRAYHADRPEAVPGDPLSLTVRLRPLGRGIYTVHWRVISAVDGHATSGIYVFGVLVDPSSAGGATATVEASVSMVEGIARSVFLIGLVVALGAAAAGIGRFGSGHELRPAALGWFVSLAGLLLLAVAQVNASGAGVLEVFRTAIGRALVWRGIALAAMGLSLGVATRGSRMPPLVGRLWLGGVALSAVAAIIVHAAAGHSGAGRWPVVPTIAMQSAHVIAIGIWLGGLVALLAGLRGAPSAAHMQSVRRFSTIAAAGLAIVTITGIVRTVQEVARWQDLASTAYGRVVLVKLVVLAAIAALGALNRWHSVPAAATDLRPLRRTAGAELGLAVIALTAAGFLGTLPPSAGAESIAGIDASGSDFGTTVRARFTAASDQPGPNRFVVQLDDYDSKSPIVADHVSLRFTPLDDPGVDSTMLTLAPGSERDYAGTGANLSFDGRWRVNILVERGDSSVDVPIEIETRGREPFRSVLRPSGQWPSYTAEVFGIGNVRISADPERAGPTRLQITCFNGILETLPIDTIIVTSGSGSSVRQLSAKRQDRNHFVAEAELGLGPNRIVVIARTEDGTRLRTSTTIEVAR